MPEQIQIIDADTLATLLSPSPDFSHLVDGTETAESVEEGYQLEARAKDFIGWAGVPPWDRVGLGTDRVFVFNIGSPDSNNILHVKEFPQEGYAVSKGTWIEGDSPLQRTYFQVEAWAERSPLRIFEFPFADRIISMLVTNQQAEQTAYVKTEVPFFEESVQIPLPELTPDDCMLMVRTDAWANPETGAPRWLAFTLGSRGLDSQTDAREPRYPITPAVVRCIDAMLQLGENYMQKNPEY